uniref:C2H2-type domain-containing protein n=1 Tax=Esox lucius TaxID=8010 RepID=A0A6Q2YTA6_ESOLU
MANGMVFHTQIASIMEVLANAAVAEICKLVDDDYAVFRLEISQSQKENRALRRKLQLLELKVARDRAERTMRERVLASRPSSVKILDRYRGMARGEGHLSGGHRSFVKPAEHNTWSDDPPVTEGSVTPSQHVIVIESADGDAAEPGGSSLVKPGAAPPVAQEDLADTAPRPRTRHSITEVSGTPNAVLKSETDDETLTVTHRGLPTTDLRSEQERPGPPGSEYFAVFHQSQRAARSHGDGDALDTGDPSCSYAGAMEPGNTPLGLETQSDLSTRDWNRYGSGVYTERCLDKKEEVIILDEVTVKVEADAPRMWNVDETHLGEGQSQDRDFLGYRKDLETQLNFMTHSPLTAFRDREPASMASSDPQGRVLFDQASNPNDQRSKPPSGGSTTGVKERRFLCTFCGKPFSCPQKVEIHQRVHTGVKPFSCTQCHMRFAQAGNLKRHQRVHTGEKPFSCPQCDKRFSHQHQLKMHLKVHTGERPFACSHCGKRFSERSYLRIHQQKMHTGQE